MTTTRDIAILGKEIYAIYTGQGNAAFSPGMAGITLPDPAYEIQRSCADSYVFEYVISGAGQVTQDQESCLVSAGDAYILQPGRYHHYLPDKKEPWQKVWFNVNGSLVRHLLSDYDLSNTLKIPGLNDGHHLFAIMETIQKEPVHCSEQLALLLHQYLLFVSGFLGSRSLKNSLPLSMKHFIEQNLTHPITIDHIAASVHLSRSRCMHLFKEAYGVTPYSYYLSQRLELAQSMLRQTNLSVQEISDRLGFSDYHHFSAFFKKYGGIAPLQYRRQQS